MPLRMIACLLAASLGAVFSVLPAVAQEGGAARLGARLPKNARWALVVLDRESGRERLAWGNALAAHLVPGSLVKLVTSGAVLDAVDKGEVPTEALLGPAKGKRKGTGEDAASAHLDRYLRQMNVHSVNHMAERLFLRLGERRYGPPPTRAKGERALAAFLAGFGLPAGELTVVDGSGLSREDRVTPRALARYLREITRRPWFPRLKGSLPRPGIEGTVKDIGYTDRRFRVKSGRLDDMFALAGYGVGRDGRKIVFVYLVNVRGKATDRRHSRGALVRLLAEESLPTGGKGSAPAGADE